MSFKRKIPWTSQPQYPVGINKADTLFALNAAVFNDPARGAGLSKNGGIPTVANELRQCLYSNDTGKYVTVTRNGAAYFQDDFVFVYHFRQNGALINGATMVQLLGTSGNNNKLDIYVLNTGVVRVDWYSSGGTVFTCDSGAIVSNNGVYRLELVQKDGTLAWFNNGVATGSPVSLGGNTRNGEAATFNLFGTATTSNNHEVALCAVTRPSPQRLGINPWQIFQPLSRNIYVEAEAGGSVGASDGIATVSGIGSSTAASPGSSAGIAAVSGVGASTTRGVGASDGIAAVSGIGAATGSGVGSSNGIAAVSGTGISTAASTGSSVGVAVVTGIAPAANDTGVGSSSGVAVVSGIGASTVAAVGSSVGVATVDGISPVISAESASNWQEYPKDFLWSRKELEPEEVEIIETLAETQAEDLKTTEEERKEQLRKALKLKNIAIELKHIEAMNALREQAINAEIAAFMKITQIEAENEEYMGLLMLAAAA